jgi:hypothetical protein
VLNLGERPDCRYRLYRGPSARSISATSPAHTAISAGTTAGSLRLAPSRAGPSASVHPAPANITAPPRAAFFVSGTELARNNSSEAFGISCFGHRSRPRTHLGSGSSWTRTCPAPAGLFHAASVKCLTLTASIIDYSRMCPQGERAPSCWGAAAMSGDDRDFRSGGYCWYLGALALRYIDAGPTAGALNPRRRVTLRLLRDGVAPRRGPPFPFNRSSRAVMAAARCWRRSGAPRPC